MKHELLVRVDNCARCGGNHREADGGPLLFQEFDRPVEIGDKVLNFWATCPNTGDPVLLHIIKIPCEGGAK